MRLQYLCLLAASLVSVFSTRIEAQSPTPDTVTVSVAASLRDAMADIQSEFERTHKATLVFNFGGSGSLEQQIEQGAPVDVFLPASSKFMDTVGSKGLLNTETRKDLLINEVVLIAPEGSSLKGFTDLNRSDVKLIALSDPESVPAGDYGRQTLQKLGLWQSIQTKLIVAKDVRQVLTYVENGDADAGLVYQTDVATAKHIRTITVAPAGSHGPIIYPVAVLRNSVHPVLARTFVAFLSSDKAQEIFKRHGLIAGSKATGSTSNSLRQFDLNPLWISAKTSLVATAFTFVLGLLAALWMSRYRGRFHDLIDGVFALPLVLPPTVLGYLLLVVFGRNSYLGQFLVKFGVMIAFSWTATVIAATVVAFPLMYRTALGAFEQVNPTLLQAARTLGASEWRVFRRVLLPVAWPGVMAGTVLAFARALGEFGATLMLAGNIPGKTQTMPVAIFFAAEDGDMNRAFGWVLIIVAVSLTVITLLNRWSRKDAPKPTRRKASNEAVAQEISIPVGVRDRSRTQQASIEIDIVKNFGDFHLQAGFSAKGGPIGLLGASGSGKSMLLRSIAGIEKPDSGRIVVNGRVLFDAAETVSIPVNERRIGILFQDYALFPHMTVRENILFGLHELPSSEQKLRLTEVVTLVHLQGLQDRYPAELSGGQKQRVALARALALRPDALLLDEPFSALDPHLRKTLEHQLREALSDYDGLVIFVTHDIEEAFRFCQELIVVDDGKLLARGPMHDLFHKPGFVRVAKLTGCENIGAVVSDSSTDFTVPSWGCSVQLPNTVTENITHLGVRAHDIQFAFTNGPVPNVFPCWLMEADESPYEVTLYLHLQNAPPQGAPSHLQMQVSKATWDEVRHKPQPWNVMLRPESLLPLQGN
jgi:molybdate transport system permease protein